MASSADTFINFSQSLEKGLQKARKEFSGFNDISNKINITFEKINDNLDYSENSYEEIHKKSKKINDNSKDWASSLSKVGDAAKRIFSIFTAGFAGLSFIDAIKDAIVLNQNMLDIAYQMGHGAAGAKKLEKSIAEITVSTGFAIDEVERMVSGLVELKIPIGMVKQLSQDALNFSIITGASTQVVQEMVAGLVKMGGLGQKSISVMLGNMVQVQRAFGISKQDMTALADKTSYITMVLRNMGKSSSDIEKMQKGTLKLAGAFSSVGLEANKATELIDRLLDPDKLEENAYLYSKLGISIQDALEGNIDPEQITRGLQSIGSELKSMSGPQASALAKALGIPLQQLRQMGNMDMKQIEKTFSGLTGSSDSLSEAYGEQAGAQRNLSNAWGKVKGVITEVALKLMPVVNKIAELLNKNVGNIAKAFEKIINAGFIDKIIKFVESGIGKIGSVFTFITSNIEKLFNPKALLIGLAAIIGGLFIFRKRFASVATDSSEIVVKAFEKSSPAISASIEEGVVGGLEMARIKTEKIYEATSKMSARYAEEAGNHIGESVSFSHKRAAAEAAAEYYKLLSEQNTIGPVKKFNAYLATSYQEMAKNMKEPFSFLLRYNKTVSDSIKERMELSQIAAKNEQSYINQQIASTSEYIQLLSERKAALEARKESRQDKKLTGEEQWEYNKIDKEILKTKQKIQDLEIKNIELEKHAEQERKKYLKTINKDELELYTRELESKEQILQDTIKNASIDKQRIETEKEILKAAEEKLKIEHNTLQTKIASGKFTTEEYQKYIEINKMLRDNKNAQDNINIELEEKNRIIEDAGKEAKAVENSIKEIKWSDEFKRGDPDKIFQSFNEKLKKSAEAFKNSISAKITETTGVLSKSVMNLKEGTKGLLDKTFVEFKTKRTLGSFAKGAARLTRAGLKGAGKIGLKIGKSSIKGVKAGIDKFKESKAGKTVGKVGKAAIGGIGAAIGGIGAAIGIFGAIMGKSQKGQELMAKIQEKLGATFEKLTPVFEKVFTALEPVITILTDTFGKVIDALMPVFNQIMNSLSPLLEELTPIFKEVFDALMPVFQALFDLIKSLLPIAIDLVKVLLPVITPMIKLIGSILVALTPLIETLVKTLLPPILKILSVLINIAGILIEAIGHLINGISKLFPGLKNVADNLIQTGKSMKEASTSISKAADKIGEVTTLSDTMDKLKGVTDKNNELTKEQMSRNFLLALKDDAKKQLLIDALNENAKAVFENTSEMIRQKRAEVFKNEIEKFRNDKDWKKLYDEVDSNIRNYFDSALIKNVDKSNYEKNITSLLSSIKNNKDFTGTEVGKYIVSRVEEAFNKKGNVAESQKELAKAFEAFNSLDDSLLSRLFSNSDKIAENMSKVDNTVNVQAFQETMFKNFKTVLEGASSELFTDKAIDDILSNATTLEDLKKLINDNKNFKDNLANYKGELLTIVNEIKNAQITNNIDRTQSLMQKLNEKMVNGVANVAGKAIKENIGKIQGNVTATPTGTAPSSTESQLEKITTKLYPAIVEASASGFVKTADAEAVTTGGTKEEREKEQIKIMEEQLHSSNLSATVLSEIKNYIGVLLSRIPS